MNKNIKEMLGEEDSVLLLPHFNPDGDTIGSAVALGLALESLNIKVKILLYDELPLHLSSIDQSLITNDLEDFDYQTVIAIDCSDEGRFKDRLAFTLGKRLINIDHHMTNTHYGQVNLVKEVAATGELIYELLQTSKLPISPEMATALYVAISTDTGHFMYSNTSPETLRIASELLALGIPFNDINTGLYQNIPFEKSSFHASVLAGARLFEHGKLALGVATKALMTETGSQDTEGLVETLRNIAGVELAILLVEKEDGYKISLRSKHHANVAKIAAHFGGGGHWKAAGCFIEGSLDHAKEALLEVVEV